ncbi:hypothetical protein [Desulfobulbus sp.]|uniref:hypothetical protein n=1 Tax=Desulfobulbus sp. TaxID=895 RepID=UPI00286F4671|nr:hypothetical protein [Desulfobulbus sp.]
MPGGVENPLKFRAIAWGVANADSNRFFSGGQAFARIGIVLNNESIQLAGKVVDQGALLFLLKQQRDMVTGKINEERSQRDAHGNRNKPEAQ